MHHIPGAHVPRFICSRVQRMLYAILPSRILLSIRQASQVNKEPTLNWSQVLGPGLSIVRYNLDDGRVNEEVEQ